MMITGDPGTGKSSLGRRIVERYRDIDKQLFITSTTAKSCRSLDTNG